MVTPKDILWPIEPHTEAKHKILAGYLAAWFPIMSLYHTRIVYVDAFCGPGRYREGEPGSPLIALDIASNDPKTRYKQVVFWFIDERQDRIEHLNRELEKIEIPSQFIVIRDTGRFDKKFEAIMNSINEGSGRPAPTFAFIDPFGFSGISFSLIQRLLKYERCEILITFMIDAINRFLEHPEDKVVQHIVDAFGTEKAIRIAKGPGNRVNELRELYQSNLQKVAKYVRYFEMRDRKDRPQYYLFFASNHELGHLKMKEAMWRVATDGEFRFSDATNANQLVLFERDIISQIFDQLRDQFGAKGMVTCSVVQTFVEDKTPFLRKHLTAALRQGEASGRIVVEKLKTDGMKRRANTYPDNAKMRILGE
jgi:three-Cys-motif partner protein